MIRVQREHPAAIPEHSVRYLLLLLPPLLRGMRYIRIPDGFPQWLRGTWIDLTAAGLLLILPILAWWRRTYDVTPERLRLQRGLIWRRTAYIPLGLVTTLTVERPLWLRMLGAAHVAADTDAGSHRTADVRLTVGREQANLFLPQTDGGYTLPIAGWRVWLLALLASDSFSGILLLATVFRQSGILLGEGLQQALLDNLEAAADAIAIIPRTAALLTMLLMAGWLLGTGRHLLRHLPFSVCRHEDTVTLRAGLFDYRTHGCAVGAIHYADRRQTLTARLLKLHTVYISCTGYGKDKNTLAVLLPPARAGQIQRELAALLPTITPIPLTLRPARGALLRYMRLPLLLLAAIPPTGQVARALFPLWQELILYLCLMATLPCLWLLAVRVLDRCSAGLGHADGRYTAVYSRRLTLHRVTIPAHKVAAVHIRQSLWQRRRGICDIKLYSYHEFRHPHRVRHLRIDEVRQLINEGSVTVWKPSAPTNWSPNN